MTLVDGLEWLITATGVVSSVMLGKRMRWGWILGLVSQLLWVYVAVVTRQWAFLPASALYVGTGVFGFARWRRDDEKDGVA